MTLREMELQQIWKALGKGNIETSDALLDVLELLIGDEQVKDDAIPPCPCCGYPRCGHEHTGAPSLKATKKSLKPRRAGVEGA
jgi:hypothetical protein